MLAMRLGAAEMEVEDSLSPKKCAKFLMLWTVGFPLSACCVFILWLSSSDDVSMLQAIREWNRSYGL